MQQVNLLVTLRAHSEKVEELKKHLTGLCALSQKEDGCLEYVSGKVDDEPTFYIKECWESAEALAKHEQTEHFIKYGPLIGECCESADIKRIVWDK